MSRILKIKIGDDRETETFLIMTSNIKYIRVTEDGTRSRENNEYDIIYINLGEKELKFLCKDIKTMQFIDELNAVEQEILNTGPYVDMDLLTYGLIAVDSGPRLLQAELQPMLEAIEEIGDTLVTYLPNMQTES